MTEDKYLKIFENSKLIDNINRFVELNKPFIDLSSSLSSYYEQMENISEALKPLTNQLENIRNIEQNIFTNSKMAEQTLKALTDFAPSVTLDNLTTISNNCSAAIEQYSNFAKMIEKDTYLYKDFDFQSLQSIQPLPDLGVSIHDMEIILNGEELPEHEETFGEELTIEEYKQELNILNTCIDSSEFLTVLFFFYFVADQYTSYEYKLAFYEKVADVLTTLIASCAVLLIVTVLLVVIKMVLRDNVIYIQSINLVKDNLGETIKDVKKYMGMD